jgi:amino acid adenylation domain-containing protein/thioester reductase-like protein
MLTRHQNLCIHQLIEQQVTEAPDAVAIAFQDQSLTRQLTYRQLNEQANQLAHYLQKLGVKPETLVGICIERSPAMIVGLLAILKAGGAYVPFDPTYPRERIALMLEDSQVPIILTQAHYASELPPHQASVVCLDTDWSQIESESLLNLEGAIAAENLAYIIYTSGSTGKPKGVMIEHRSLTNFVQAISQEYAVTPCDRLLQFASISFDVAVEEIFVSLVQGATLVLRSQEMLRSIPAFFQACEVLQITVLNVPTAFWHQICVELPQVKIPDTVRLVVIGSERALPRWLSVWKEYAPSRIRLINAYGPTEATVSSTLCDLAGPNAVEVGDSITEHRILPIGKAIANVQTYVLDLELQPVGVGVTGELYIAGAGLARGYLNRPDLTVVKFIYKPHGYEGRIRLYKTGDLVRCRPDGNLEFLDRTDHQEKIRGFRIELSEIETVLEQHSDVQQAIVIAREDVPGEKRLVSYVVPCSIDPASENLVPKLRSYLKEKLPSYMVPAAFVFLNTLPLTPNGKVDRRDLPAPNCDRPLLDEAFVAPRTPLEQELAQLWSQVLRIAEIGIYDNFFELGGDSLRLTQLISQVETVKQKVIPLVDFLRIPTVARLASLVQRIHPDGVLPERMSLPQLQAEAMLDHGIQAQSFDPLKLRTPQTIFLTGATGFIGSFLLHELLQQTSAKIYCLVRVQHHSEAHLKLRSTLEHYSLDTDQLARIIPVVGDLSQPQFGLTEQQFQTLADSIDTVYHSGANVNLLYPYSVLYHTNVRGTHDILKLVSCGKPKFLHYFSTLDVFESVAETGVRVFYEQDNIAQGEGLFSGYAQSKWVAEQLVKQGAERGLPICIYRPGMVTGHSQTGHANPKDIFCRFVKSLIQLRQAPNLNLMIDMTPVDYLSRALVHLSLQPQSLGKIFHLVNPVPLALDQLVDQLNQAGYSIRQVPYLQWQAQLKLEPNELSPLATLMTEAIADSQRLWLERWLGGNDVFNDTQTKLGLQGQAITCPPTDKLLNTYLNYLARSNFLAAPQPSLFT